MKMSDFNKKNLARENRWQIILGCIVAVLGGIFNYLLPSLQLVSYILQVLALFVIVTILITITNRYQRKTIELFTDATLSKIENKYKGITCDSTNLFKVFQLNDGSCFYSVAHNIFFRILIKSYYNDGENRNYCITIDTYYELIKTYLSMGYKMKTINGLLLPFWYAPKEKDKILVDYTDFCKQKTELIERVTYYQDYKNNEWKDNTVRMIYEDLLTSEKSDDVAVRWLITLILKISKLKNAFGRQLEGILGIQLKGVINYFLYNELEFIDIIKKKIDKVTKFLDSKSGGIVISRQMTSIINDLFLEDMKGRNKFIAKSDIVAMFAKDVINFEDVTAVCYFYRESLADEQFVILLNGNNTGPSVEIEIVTKEDRINKIQTVITDLLKL
jgi:hypothetical protein